MKEPESPAPSHFKREALVMITWWVTVPLLAVIAMIAFTNIASAIQRGKQRVTIRNIKTIVAALQHSPSPLLPLQVGRHYSAREVLQASKGWQSDSKMFKDAWGNDIIVIRTETSFVVASPGRDRKLEETTPETIEDRFSPEQDLVWREGKFISVPKGMQ